jgi:hypothetical protein
VRQMDEWKEVRNKVLPMKKKIKEDLEKEDLINK